MLVDAAQSVQHLAARDVQALDADFYAFSGHKMYAPMGIGVLYAKESWLEKLPPYQFGGEMIDQVSSTRVTFTQLPHKFEAGTPNVEGAVGLGAAVDYLNQFDPLETIIPLAHAAGVPVLVDAAQSVQHLAARDVQALDADFYAFSGHKMYAPMGIGILYAKESWLEKLPPYQYGGEMIDQVSSTRVTFTQLPHKFEAGTPNVEGAVGLGAAVD